MVIVRCEGLLGSLLRHGRRRLAVTGLILALADFLLKLQVGLPIDVNARADRFRAWTLHQWSRTYLGVPIGSILALLLTLLELGEGSSLNEAAGLRVFTPLVS